jgi:hypothetical protein
MTTNVHFLYYPAQFFLEWEIFKRICRENRNTYFTLNKFYLFLQSVRLLDKVEKYCRAGQSTEDNMAHAPCMLDS